MVDGPAVSVIVAARDAEATIGRCIDALMAQELNEPVELVVVDDGSADATAKIARERGARVIGSDGTGAAAARNTGLRHSAAPVVAFTDADCFPTSGWLAAGLAAMAAADLVQGPVLPDPHARRGPFDRTLDVRGPSGWYATANLFARRTFIDAVGGFEEMALDHDAHGRRQPLGEDTLLAWRIRRAGGVPAFAAGAVVHHAVFARTARQYVLYRKHWRRLPEVVRAVPELRSELLYRRLFLERRTALFDAAVLGLVLAGCARRPAPLACALPYAWLISRETQGRPATAMPRFAAARVSSDVVAAACLLAGSLRARAPVL